MEKVNRGDIEIVKITVNPLFRMLAVYLYFIDGVLIDTGPSIRRRSLIPVFQNWNISQVALTHHHEDHTGMAPWIAKHLSGSIYCHEKTSDKKLCIPWYREIFSSKTMSYPSVIQTAQYEFQPIETPGHTYDHVCLWEPNKGWLFTGDLYVTPYPKVFLKEESITSYIDSLQKLSRLDYDTVFCGHDGIIPNGKEMMNRKLDYLQNIRHEVICLHQLGCSDKEIIQRMFPEKVRLELMSFGAFSRMNLVHACYRE